MKEYGGFRLRFDDPDTTAKAGAVVRDILTSYKIKKCDWIDKLEIYEWDYSIFTSEDTPIAYETFLELFPLMCCEISKINPSEAFMGAAEYEVNNERITVKVVHDEGIVKLSTIRDGVFTQRATYELQGTDMVLKSVKKGF